MTIESRTAPALPTADGTTSDVSTTANPTGPIPIPPGDSPRLDV